MSDSLTPWTVVYEILQARILEQVAIPYSWRSSQPRDRTQVSCIPGRFFYCLSHQGSPNIEYLTNSLIVIVDEH